MAKIKGSICLTAPLQHPAAMEPVALAALKPMASPTSPTASTTGNSSCGWSSASSGNSTPPHYTPAVDGTPPADCTPEADCTSEVATPTPLSCSNP